MLGNASASTTIGATSAPHLGVLATKIRKKISVPPMIVPKNGAPKLMFEVCARTKGARNTAAIGRTPAHASTCSQARLKSAAIRPAARKIKNIKCRPPQEACMRDAIKRAIKEKAFRHGEPVGPDRAQCCLNIGQERFVAVKEEQQVGYQDQRHAYHALTNGPAEACKSPLQAARERFGAFFVAGLCLRAP